MKRAVTNTPDVGEGLRRLRCHEQDCEECRAGDRLDAPALAGLLSSEGFEIDTAALIETVSRTARFELARLEARRLRRRTYRHAALAALPLPVVLVYAAAMLRALYGPVAGLLGSGAADYFAAVHVGLLTLLFGVTYAAIPLVLGRSARRAPGLTQARA